MTETSAFQPAPLPFAAEESLRLACPRCGGGLNLMRQHLGMLGQCVHCRTPLIAREEGGAIYAVADGSSSAEADPAWGFPDPSASSGAPAFAAPLPTRESDNFFTGRPGTPTPVPLPATESAPSPFGLSDASSPSMFASGGESASIATAWGTKVPGETHASISPFGTGSAGASFAESFFREKVAKESSPVVPTDGEVAKEGEALASHVFKQEGALDPKRLLRQSLRVLAVLCAFGVVGIGVGFLVPKETLASWRGKAIDWLEPGMAVFDGLPESLRPAWLPRPELGIAADQQGLGGFEGFKGAAAGPERLNGR